MQLITAFLLSLKHNLYSLLNEWYLQHFFLTEFFFIKHHRIHLKNFSETV